MRDPDALAMAFHEAINRRDIAGLTGLMDDDHKFIDILGGVVAGKPAANGVWAAFFAAFPDYRNEVETTRVNADTVTMAGLSHCSHPGLAGPALWRAKVRSGLVAEWQVYADTAENREALSLDCD